MRVIYLSPHADDVTLSCGGRLWVEQARGLAPRVITVCAGIPPLTAVPPFAAVQHAKWGSPPRPMALRRAEDRAALARLGITDVIDLDVFDAVYRVASGGRPLYGSEEGIFGDLDPVEHRRASMIANEITRFLPAPGTGEIVAPLCVGHHVDHLLTHAVARALAAVGHRVLYYEEFPYAATPARLEAALADKPGWQAERIALDESALAAKVAAASYYRSQIPVLFGDDLSMDRTLRAYAAKVAPPGSAYGERFWYPGPEGGA
ncbi:MAG: PIG-L family deacetylase [Ardenticatenaceae bacterium]|nr:PIG-L family deacetylase [Ardenticatenaceae bacterium]